MERPEEFKHRLIEFLEITRTYRDGDHPVEGAIAEQRPAYRKRIRAVRIAAEERSHENAVTLLRAHEIFALAGVERRDRKIPAARRDVAVRIDQKHQLDLRQTLTQLHQKIVDFPGVMDLVPGLVGDLVADAGDQQFDTLEGGMGVACEGGGDGGDAFVRDFDLCGAGVPGCRDEQHQRQHDRQHQEQMAGAHDAAKRAGKGFSLLAGGHEPCLSYNSDR